MEKFDQLKTIDQRYYCSDYYDCSVNKYGVKYGTSLRFWENKCCINEMIPHGWFHWYFRYCLGRRSKDNKRKINRWLKIVSRFRGKLVNISKDAGSKFDDYSISPTIKQILLHWDYEFTEEDFLLIQFQTMICTTSEFNFVKKILCWLNFGQ